MSQRTALRVVLYGRTSIDASDGRSVDDQLAILTDWATGHHRQIVETLRDDGVSASRFSRKRKTRPDWERAMELVRTGQTDELAVWEISRNTRDRAVWAALIAACIDNRVNIVVDGKVHDPADPDAGFMLDLGAAMAVRESSVISKRTKRAVDSRAAAGRPHGSLPYGYRRLLDPVTGKAVAREIDPAQAPVVREIAERLLAGDTATGIARDLNARGIPTANGRRWQASNLAKLVQRPTYAGLRVHDGKVLQGVSATWEPILSIDEHLSLVALFADPARDQFRNGTSTKHLGTGIYRCGRDGCDGRVRVIPAGKRQSNRYDCRDCHKISRQQGPVDELVEATMVAWLSRGDFLERVATLTRAPRETQSAAQEVARQREKLANLRAAWDEDRISLDAYVDMEAKVLARIEEAERVATPRSVPAALTDAAGPDAAAKWAALPIGEKRLAVSAVMVVTLLPVQRGHWRWDPTRVRIEWK